jgi:hypothetical protein
MLRARVPEGWREGGNVEKAGTRDFDGPINIPRAIYRTRRPPSIHPRPGRCSVSLLSAIVSAADGGVRSNDGQLNDDRVLCARGAELSASPIYRRWKWREPAGCFAEDASCKQSSVLRITCGYFYASVTAHAISSPA